MTERDPPPSGFVAILAAHGDRGGASPNETLWAQVKSVQALMPALPLFAGMLKGEPSIEDALGQAAKSNSQRILIYPLFMAEGYFVRKLGERIAATGYAGQTALLPPLGLDPALPTAFLNEALASASSNGLDAQFARLLIVGHGSKLGPASATATRKVAARVALARKFASVTTAFLEEEPFLEDALRTSSQPTIVAGSFFGEGMHGSDDVRDAISETGATAFYAGAIGNSAAVTPLIAAALNAEASK